MLRRDLQYVLTWDASEHCWRATPVTADALKALRMGAGTTLVNVVDLPENALSDEGA